MPYDHLNGGERYAIEQQRLYGLSYREIGRRLGRHHTTVSREVTRNGPRDGYGTYVGEIAEARARKRRHWVRHLRRRAHFPLYCYVCAKLRLRWSPQQIAGRLLLDFADEAAMRVAPETIYSWIYADAAAGGTLFTALRRKHKKRRRQRRLARARQRFPGRVPIEERPPIVDARERYGDWEGDTVMGGLNKGSVLTLIERKSRFLMAAKLENRTAEALCRQAKRLMKPLPQAWRQTLTVDNGSEFAWFWAIENDVKIDVYFAEPYKAWQRGANENVNGLLRQYLPKGCDIRKTSSKTLEFIVTEINNRPRKCLGYRTPFEVRIDHGGALST